MRRLLGQAIGGLAEESGVSYEVLLARGRSVRDDCERSEPGQDVPRWQRRYLVAWVGLAETIRKVEAALQRQAFLEKLEDALEAAAAGCSGPIPLREAHEAVRESAAPLEDEDGEQRQALQFALAERALAETSAGHEDDNLVWVLRRATHALSSRRSGMHYKLFTLEHDNRVLRMHLAALLTRVDHLRAEDGR